MMNIDIAKTFFKQKQYITLLFGGVIFISILWWIQILPHDLWYDEVFTSNLVRNNWWTVFVLSARDMHPPLYNIILRLFIDVFGYNIITLRMVSYLAYIGILVLAVSPINQILGPKRGMLFAFIYTFSPVMCVYILEIRMYMCACLFVTVCVIHMYQFFVAAKTHNAVIACIFGIFAAYTHYYALVAVAAAYAVIFIYLLAQRNFHFLYRLSICIFISIVSYIPWIYALAKQMGRFFSTPYIENIKWYQFIISPAYFYYLGTNRSHNFRYIYIYISFPIIICIAGIIIVGLYNIIKNKLSFSLPVFCIFVSTITMLFFVLFSIFIKPLYNYRYLMCLFGLICIFLSDFFSYIKSKTLITMILCVFVISSMLKLYIEDKMYGNSQVANIYQHIGNMKSENSWIISNNDSFSQNYTSFYLPNMIKLNELPSSDGFSKDGWMICFSMDDNTGNQWVTQTIKNSTEKYVIEEEIVFFFDVGNRNCYAAKVKQVSQ